MKRREIERKKYFLNKIRFLNVGLVCSIILFGNLVTR